MTIRFLGNIDNPEKHIESLSSIKTDFQSINLSQNGIGFFPDKKRPNVIYLGFKGDEEKCLELENKIDASLDKLGFKADKNFKPHITLGRFKKKYNLRNINFDIKENINLMLDRFYLMESKFGKESSSYTELKEFKFRK